MQRRMSCIAVLGLIALLALGGGAPVGAAAPIVVSPANMNGWYFYDDKHDSLATATGKLVDGPGTPPLGTGSANLSVIDANDGQLLATRAYGGQRLSAITTLQYYTYVSASSSAPQDISLQFDLDYNLNGTTPTYQGRLVYEPANSGGTVLPNTWQNWDVLAANSRVWATRAPDGTKNNIPCPQSAPCLLSAFKTLYPNAGIANFAAAPGLIGFEAGSGYAVFNANVDAFTIGVSATDTTYDFEAIDPGTLTTGTTLAEPAGTTLTGAIVTGADVHAVQVCAFVATPTGTTAGTNTVGTLNDFGHKAQSYNGSGAVSITPLTLNYPSGSVLLLATYDLTPTTAGAASNAPSPEQACPAGTATFGPAIAGKTLPAVTGLTDVVRTLSPATSATMTLLDVRYVVVA